MQLASRKYPVVLSLLAGIAFASAACSRVEQPAASAAVEDAPAATTAPEPISTPPAVADAASPATVAPEPESTPPPTSTPSTSASASFDSPQTLGIGKSATFADGLIVELNKIDDSRCPANIQCIWAGQLAPELSLHGGELKSAQTISLGTVRTKTQAAAPYVVTLIDAGSDSATLTVTKSGAAATKVP